MKKLILLLLFIFVGISYSQWINVSTGLSNGVIRSFTTKNSILYISTSTGIYSSTNDGNNWNANSFQYNTWGLTTHDNWLYASTFSSPNQGTYRTFNGETWSRISTTIYGTKLYSAGIYLFSNNISTNVYGIYRYNGSQWINVLDSISINNICSTSNYLFVSNGSKIWKSSNYGDNWDIILTSSNLLKSVNDKLFRTTSPFVSLLNSSTNQGISWSSFPIELNYYWDVLPIDEQKILMGGRGNNPLVKYTSNGGASWIDLIVGLPSTGDVRILYKNNNFIFASLDESIYRIDLNQFVGINNNNSIPKIFSLSQNFPNPFNPVTNIKFDLPEKVNAQLKIYDLLGREMETLVNEQLNAGTYETEWNASKYSSGVYYYKITAGNYNQTNKMILIK